ncbi:type II toxin-antitoxin system HicA family toxin [Fodinicola acaciae]|uniref:type II toxin-antitoxin system HicA family toxin n=1 Tax=Fodinicola acaciae TaxID=2681555 RepID=UPI001C9E5163
MRSTGISPPRTAGGARPTTVRETIRRVEADGWVLIGVTGSHRHYKHPVKPGRVTIAGKPSTDLSVGTERSIPRQAGLRRR